MNLLQTPHDYKMMTQIIQQQKSDSKSRQLQTNSFTNSHRARN